MTIHTYDGRVVEFFRGQFSGAVEITEEECRSMAAGRTVVMLVATHVHENASKQSETTGDYTMTCKQKIQSLIVLDGNLREQALQFLATGTDRGFQGVMSFAAPEGVDAETGEVQGSQFADYAQPAPDRQVFDETEDDEFDVPPADPDPLPDQPTVLGDVRGYTGTPESGNGDGPKVGPVDPSQLADINAAPTGPAVPRPQGEVVGSVHRPGKPTDKILDDFFKEEDPRG